MTALQQKTDVQLMTEILAGDREAFGSLYGRYAPGLYRYLLGMLRHALDSEDLLQDIFTSVLIRAKNGGIDNVKNYLYQSARNRVTDFKRKRREKEMPTDVNVFAASQDEMPLLDAEEIKQLNQLLTELPDNQREVVLMKIQGDLTFNDLQTILGVPVKTVQSRYRLGIEKLRRKVIRT